MHFVVVVVGIYGCILLSLIKKVLLCFVIIVLCDILLLLLF